jgi:hypothetical protein
VLVSASKFALTSIFQKRRSICFLVKPCLTSDYFNDQQVELSNPEAELRLLEVFYHKIYKVSMCSFTNLDDLSFQCNAL